MMKAIFTLTFICTFFLASGQNCTNLVSNLVFQQKFNQIATMPNNQMKLNKAKAFVQSTCLTSTQVKTIAVLFTQDSYRLEFCKIAVHRTLDQINFYDVYDAFSTFSAAFRLHDYIHDNELDVSGANETTPPPPPPPTGPSFPNLAYPSAAGYTGAKGCEGNMISSVKFEQVAKNVFQQPTDESKSIAITNATNDYCLTFAELMKLTSLMQAEPMRLSLMQSVFLSIYDLDNYPSGVVLFTTTDLQVQWTTYVNVLMTETADPVEPVEPDPPVCMVTETDFNNVLRAVKNESFPQDKKATMELAAKDRCFSVAQIKVFLKEFTFGSDRMDVAKKLYHKCTNKSDAYQITDSFTFSSEKNDWKEFIKNN
jgi:hypothetical protein